MVVVRKIVITSEFKTNVGNSAINLNKVTNSTEKLAEATKKTSKNMGLFSTHIGSLGYKLTRVRIAFFNIAVTASLLGMGVYKLTKSFIDLESELSDVRKRTGMSKAEVNDLADSFRKLSSYLPISATELAKISVVAGQLGIKGKENISAFTKSIAMISVATDVSSDKLAISLAKISQAFGLPISNVLSLGSVINKLENTTAANTDDILKGLQKVGAASRNLGISVQFASAIQATLVGAGVSADRAGTRFARALQIMATKTSELSKLTNEDNFDAILGSDSDEAVLMVVDAVKQIADPVERAATVAKIFGRIGGEAVLTISNNTVKLRENLANANNEMEKGMSILIATITKMDTIKSQWKLIGNDIKNSLNDQDGWLSSVIGGITGMIGLIGDNLSDDIAASATGAVIGSAVPVIGTGVGASVAFTGALLTNIVNAHNKGNELVETIQNMGKSAGLSEQEISDMLEPVKESDSLFVQLKQLEAIKDNLVSKDKDLIAISQKLVDGFGYETATSTELQIALNKANKEVKDNGSVSEETRKKIKELTDELYTLQRISNKEYTITVLDDLNKKLDELELNVSGTDAFNLLDVLYPGDFKRNSIDMLNILEESYNAELDIIKRNNEKIKAEDEKNRNRYKDALEWWKNEGKAIGLPMPTQLPPGKQQAEIPFFVAWKTSTGKDIGETRELAKLYDQQSKFKEQEAEKVKELKSYYSDLIAQQKILVAESKKELDIIKQQESAKRSSISNILSRRWTINGISETSTDSLIAKQQLELRKAEFATLGLGTAEEYLRNTTLITANQLDNTTESLERLSNATASSQDRFNAWKTTLNETIKDLVMNSSDLDRDVTSAVQNAQTELLAISQGSNNTSNSQFKVMQDQVQNLQTAQEIFFGEEKNKLTESEKLREDRINGVNTSAKVTISLLEYERKELDKLIDKEKELNKVYEDRKRVLDDLNRYKSAGSGLIGGGTYVGTIADYARTHGSTYNPNNSSISDKVDYLTSGGFNMSSGFASKVANITNNFSLNGTASSSEIAEEVEAKINT